MDRPTLAVRLFNFHIVCLTLYCFISTMVGEGPDDPSNGVRCTFHVRVRERMALPSWVTLHLFVIIKGL